MTHIINIGMNHKTAPVELRECMARDPDSVFLVLKAMRESPLIQEGLFLSTCNRVEALYITESADESMGVVIKLLEKVGGLKADSLHANLYTLVGMDSVRHVFQVASSLDSMVVGEPQILGQIKEAYFHATKEKTSGVVLNRLMHRAFHVAKRVRTETGVSDAAVSISYAAVELAKKIFHDLVGRSALLIGAGEMAELAAKHLLKNGIGKISVANRTFGRAVEVAGLIGGAPVDFREIEFELPKVDIVITSTASREYVITHEQVKMTLRKRKNRPLFLIDIAVPRDVEPRVNDLGNVFVYDIDDLKSVVEVNRSQRQDEAVRAERIVEEEVLRFERWLKTLGVVPTIVSLKEKVEAIRKAEISKSMGSLGALTPDQRHSIEVLTASIAEKIIHDPIVTLKRKADRPSRDQVLDMTRQLFKLDEMDAD